MLGLLCLFLLIHRLRGEMWHFRPLTRWLVLSSITLVPGLLASAYAIWRKIPKYAVTLELDRQLGGGDLVTSAWAFAQRTSRSVLEELVVRLALQRLRSTNLRALVPIRVELRQWVPFCGAVALAAVGSLCTPKRGSERFISSPGAGPPAIHVESVAGEAAQFRAILAEDEHDAIDEESRRAVHALMLVMERWARGEVNRSAVDEALLAWEVRLGTEDRPIQPELAGLGRALTKHRSTEQLGSALADGRPKDAKLALDALEKRSREPRNRMSAVELQALRKAVETERASRQRSQAEGAAELARLGFQQKELLKKGLNGPLSATEQQQLDVVARHLERLERQEARAARTEAALSALERAILEAAEQLRADLQAELPAFERARTELTRWEQLARSDAEKRALLAKIRQLRELLRHQDRSRSPRIAALERYGQRAAGQWASGSQNYRRPTHEKADQASATPRPSQTIGMEVVPIPLIDQPNPTEEAGSTAGPPSLNTSRGGAGRDAPAFGSSDEHVAHLRGESTSTGMTARKDTAAVSGDTGAGTVSAVVVAVAGVRGFAGPEYGEVFRAYAPVVESLLARPELPFSHKAQVRRYFQLISPRESKP